jgi:hypothetical protein
VLGRSQPGQSGVAWQLMANGRHAVVLLVCLLAAACGQVHHELTPWAGPFTAAGSVFLLDAGEGAQGSPCQGLRSRGFADLSGDTLITVTDGPGNVVRALLHQGTFAPSPEGIKLRAGSKVVCAFPFSVENIAGGQPPYSLTVADRGRVRCSRGEAEAIQLVVDDTGLTRISDIR